MIADLSVEAARYGLKFHMGKTKVLTNAVITSSSRVKCGEHYVDIVEPEESEKYLGRKLSIGLFHRTELDNRIAFAWASFLKYKSALCNRRLAAKDRIKLF